MYHYPCAFHVLVVRISIYVNAYTYIYIYIYTYSGMNLYRYPYVCTYTYVHIGTGWRRPIGCLKLQVVYRTRATNHRALLRKITYKEKASCGSLLPCTNMWCTIYALWPFLFPSLLVVLFVLICIYVYIYMFVYTYTYICVYIYIRGYTYVDIHTNTLCTHILANLYRRSRNM